MLEPGQIIIHGKYRVSRRIGAGGMGEVHEASAETLRRLVALKAIRPRPDESGRSRVTHRELNEARVAAQLTHPNIVEIHDAEIVLDDRQNEILVIVMELVQGHTLSAWLSQHGRQELTSTTEAMHLAHQLLEGVAHAHARHVIHRDLKPTNIMLQEQPDAPQKWQAVITDFGLSVSLRNRHYEAQGGPACGRSLYGSAMYMPPEQLSLWARRRRREAHFADDVHALGVLLWQILARSCERHPLYVEADRVLSWSELTDEDLPAVLRCMADGKLQYAPLTETDIPEAFLWTSCNQLIQRALGFSGPRPETARALLEELQHILREFERQQRNLRDYAAHKQGEAYGKQQVQHQLYEAQKQYQEQRAAERRHSQRVFAKVLAGASLAVSLSVVGAGYKAWRLEMREQARALEELRRQAGWAPACGREEAVALLHTSEIGDEHKGPRWAVLIPAGQPDQVHIVECGTGKLLHRLGHRQLKTDRGAAPEHGLLVRFSPESGSVLVADGTYSFGPYARFLTAASLLAEVGAARWSIKEAAFATDGSALLLPTDPRHPTVRLSGGSHARDRHLEQELPSITAAVQSLDGRLVAAGNGEGRIALWRPDASGELVLQTRPPLSISVSRDAVRFLALSLDQRWLAASYGGPRVWIYDLAELASVGSPKSRELIPAAGHKVSALSFASDGTLLIGSSDQVVRGFSLSALAITERMAQRVAMMPKRVDQRDGLLVAADDALLTVASTEPEQPPSSLSLVVQDARWLRPSSGGFLFLAKREGSRIHRFAIKSPQHLSTLLASASAAQRELGNVLLPLSAEPQSTGPWLRWLSGARDPAAAHSGPNCLSGPFCALLRSGLDWLAAQDSTGPI